MILRKRFAVIRDEPNRANGLAGLVLCLWRGYSLRMRAMVVLLLDIDCICEMDSCPWNDFLVRGVTLSMAGNARRGPHCIRIVFLCQEWRLGGLFFAGWSFAMKSMLPPIRQNVFLAVSHSPFLELLTLQKGPIVPLSAMTPLLGRNGRFEGARRRCACSSPAVCLTLRYVLLVVCRSLPISRFCQSLSAVCRLASGACHSVWPLPSAPGLSALSLAASPWRLLLFVRVALSVAFCGRLPFSPIAVCRTSAAPLWR